MSASALVLDEHTERIAVGILRHLEWQPDSFSLLFLFADAGPARALAEWLDERLGTSGAPLQRRGVESEFAAHPEATVDALVRDLGALSAAPGAVWLSAHEYPIDDGFNRARRVFLARLNERRFILERDLVRPLVLVLPVGFKSDARSIAPDIWHIRARSEVLAARQGGFIGEITQRAEGRVSGGGERSVPAPSELASMPAYAELQRIWGTAPERLDLPVAWEAINELQAARYLEEARGVAERTVDLAATRSDRRDYLLSLGYLSRVAEAAGDLDLVESASRRCLVVARELCARDGETPENLRDLSVALSRMGRVLLARGDRGSAESTYHEGLSVARLLVERHGRTDLHLRDLSLLLNDMGDVLRERSELEAAERAYQESLSVGRELNAHNATEEGLRDLSVTLNRVGGVALDRGELDAAERAYQESLSIRRKLHERIATPESLRDLVASVDNLGGLYRARGERELAEQLYREGLSMARELRELRDDSAQALDDLVISIVNLGSFVDDDVLLGEAQSICEQLVARFPSVPSYAGRLHAVQELRRELQDGASSPA